MASEPRGRRGSRELPPDLSELMNKLIEYANSFIREFDNKRPKIRETVGEFQEIVRDVKWTEEGIEVVETAGAGDIGIGIGIGILGIGIITALFSGGSSLAAAAAAAAAGAAAAAAAGVLEATGAVSVAAGVIGAAAAGAGVSAGAAAAAGAGAAGAVALGGAAVVGAIRKKMEKKRRAEKLEKLGKEFMKIIEPLKNDLEEIKTTCEKLEERSVKVQAENTLRDMEEFQRILRRVAELRTTDSIIQSGDQCQTVVDKFDQMKNELEDFTEK